MKPVNGNGIKRAVLINDLSCFGKCSLSVSIPILSAYGVETVALPTAVLSTHTAGFENYVVRDMTWEMEAFAKHWKHIGLRFDCIMTGFFCSVKQLQFARRFVEDFRTDGTLVIVDPVLGDNGALYGCFSAEYAAEMRELAKLADFLTPNHTEATLLAGVPFDTGDDEILRLLNSAGCVITSAVHEGKTGYLADFGSGTVRIEKPVVDLNLHGAGDVFASTFAGELMAGCSAESALKNAADFCERCILDTEKRQPAHWYGVWFEDELARRGQWEIS